MSPLPARVHQLAEVSALEDRAIPGHWEGDLLGGARNSNGNAGTTDRGKKTPDQLLGQNTKLSGNLASCY